jgi:hypothetical protein
MIPLAWNRMSLERIVGTCNQSGYSRNTIIVIMERDWHWTWAVGMNQQSCWGVLWFFKRPQVSPLEKQSDQQQDLWCLITNTCANRVAIVSSVITRYLTLRKHWTFMIQPSDLFMFSASVNRTCCQFFCYFFISVFVSQLFNSVLFC